MNDLQVLGHFAQSVVEQFSSLLDIPISITDNTGMIIGSTDNKRLGSHHIVTAEVTKSGKIMFFSKEQIAGLVNVLPGIAAPLSFQQQTIGVLGLIGDPATVERYVPFVQSHIEMLIMENFRAKTIVSKMETMQHFIQCLLSYKEGEDLRKIQNYCEIHGFSLGLSRRCILLDIPSTVDQLPSIKEVQLFNQTEQDLFLYLTKLFVDNEQDLVIPLKAGQWLVVKHLNAEDTSAIEKKLDYVSDSLQVFLQNRDMDSKFMLSYGECFSTIEGILHSYEQSRKAMAIAKRNNFQQSIVSISDWNLLSLALVEEMKLPSRQTLDKYIEKLSNHANGAALIESFLVYCEEQLNMSQAARKLYLHRNTLIYRIQQLQQLLTIDLHSFKQCTLLYLALKQHEHNKKLT
ncbi:sugar diacid recognition domain-containing protein [Sporosarcina sp. JAI121]|uniref:sugar diacid recognition domain-containing protein n=1 Tax=Sporosarcina sp. JAI121 TaxID=2723064 RepID=UPI0015C7312E|nr:carbohydrate diacid regulator [Sporosarcina sp. JAI121]